MFQALNDLAEQQNIPFEFLDGFIEKMSVSVPWSSILHDASYIEVRGLALTIKHKERDKSSKYQYVFFKKSFFNFCLKFQERQCSNQCGVV